MFTIIVLLLLGLFFVVAEVFFPSLGAFGLAAAAALVGADILAYGAYGGGALAGLIAIEVVAVPLLLRTSLRLLPRFGLGRQMMLPAAPPDPSSAIDKADHLVDAEGETLSDLRPSGTALLHGERRSVVAAEGMIAAGTRIRVASVEGFRIVVRPIKP